MTFRPEPEFQDDYAFEQVEPGVWLGETEILGLLFHVHAIELREGGSNSNLKGSG